MRNRLILCLLILMYAVAHAITPAGLKDAQVHAEGTCIDAGRPFHCFFLEKNAQKYVAYVDIRGPVVIFTIREFKETYEPGELVKVWQRDEESA